MPDLSFSQDMSPNIQPKPPLTQLETISSRHKGFNTPKPQPGMLPSCPLLIQTPPSLAQSRTWGFCSGSEGSLVSQQVSPQPRDRHNCHRALVGPGQSRLCSWLSSAHLITVIPLHSLRERSHPSSQDCQQENY